MAAHAICSPSGASGWMNCSGWEGSSTSSKWSREGTAAHELAAKCLELAQPAANFLDLTITIENDVFVVDTDMAAYVQTYLDIVNNLGGELFVEQRLSIEHITGEAGAEGTADAVVLSPDHKSITVIDLKYGRGEEVYAEENEQLQMYALAALEHFSIMGEFDKIKMIIVQPRIHNISEWSASAETLNAFGARVKIAATKKLGNVIELNPGEKTCRWCVKKTDCSAVINMVRDNITKEFDAVGTELAIPREKASLATVMKAVPFIEDFCRAVRAKVESELLSGNPVDGFKLVEGRKGYRTWANKEEVETILKNMRLKQEEMYDFSLISPTQAEKLLKGQPKRWARVEDLITRKDGQPSVVPMGDKRQPLQIATIESGFEVLEHEGEQK